MEKICDECKNSVVPIRELGSCICPYCLYYGLFSSEIYFCYTCCYFVNSLICEEMIDTHKLCCLESSPLKNIAIAIFKHPGIRLYHLEQQFKNLK